ncbi:MAG TPA: hypothetical protein VF647_17435 [Longimicrobium sp.]|jgi:hypothetical protein
MPHALNAEPIHSAAWNWEIQSMLGDRSVLHPAQILWTTDNIRALRDHLAREGERRTPEFLNDLRRRLDGAPAHLTQLAAEVLWLMLLFDRALTAEAKRSMVATISAWSGEQLVDGRWASDLGYGAADLWTNEADLLGEMIHLLDLARELKRDIHNRAAVGGSYAIILDHAAGTEQHCMRHVLLHLLFPESYEPIPSLQEKWAIAETFAELIGTGEPTDEWYTPLNEIDARLRIIRSRLAEGSPDRLVDFYSPELRARWSTRVPHVPPRLVPLPDGWPELSEPVRHAITYAAHLSLGRFHPALLFWSFLDIAKHRDERGSAACLRSVVDLHRWTSELPLVFAGLVTHSSPDQSHFSPNTAACAGPSSSVNAALSSAATLRDSVSRDSEPGEVSARHVLGALLWTRNPANAIDQLQSVGFQIDMLVEALIRYVEEFVPSEDPARWETVLGLDIAKLA